MATKCLTWISCSCLPCNGSTPAEVILCVPSEKLLNENLHTIPAILTSVTASCPGSCGNYYSYTFCFDDALLAEGAALLATDISGVVCKDCLTTWVEDQSGGGGFLVQAVRNDDGTITFTLDQGEFTYIPGIGDGGNSQDVAATGSDFATAFQLATYLVDVTEVAEDAGVILKDSAVNVGSIIKHSAEDNDLLVYPPTLGAHINDLSDGAPFGIGPGDIATCYKLSDTYWICFVGTSA